MNSYDQKKAFEYEEGFLLTSGITRTAKILALYEAYKMIRDVPGVVVECGVYKGLSFATLATLRSLTENSSMRKLIGFDTFDKFALTSDTRDKKIVEEIETVSGLECISTSDLMSYLSKKGVGVSENIDLVKGDICFTAKAFAEENPGTRIALLSIDVDFGEPTQAILDYLYPLVTVGGVVLIDDYGTFPSESDVIDSFIEKNGYRLRQFPFARHPCYLIKGEKR
ncbi:class I SAM-dependent methyltransferase [Candidatus Kaiserbacteria bacterium]|nr:class I SAM-dependent methyltransferase [Candidatus Kaiserbacteria bacterium]